MQSQDPSAENRQEFEAALGALVRAAERAEVEVNEAHDVAAHGWGRWEVEISRVGHESEQAP